MTANNLLLHHLAGLMLEQQQHILPVDELFDDEIISEFVKSVQIDSPYQQMLLEGVLTESVRDEKLYVSFTVEGYFHYVLGEVIYQQTSGMGPKALQDFLVHNQLNGIRQGIEQCLIRDVQKNDLSRLMWLIDSAETTNDVCILPLAFSLINVRVKTKTNEEYSEAITEQINVVIGELLAEPTSNDYEILEGSISYLESTERQFEVKLLYTVLNRFIKPKISKESILYLKSLEHIDDAEKSGKLEMFEEKGIDADFYQSLAIQFSKIADYKKAIEFSKRSLDIRSKYYGEDHVSCGESYKILSDFYFKYGDYNVSLNYANQALDNYKINFGENHWKTGDIYNLLGNIYTAKNELDRSIQFANKVLDIRLKTFGYYHSYTAYAYNNLAINFNEEEEYERALFNFNIAYEILRKTNDNSIHVILRNIGRLWLVKNEPNKAQKYFEKALLKLNSIDQNHPDVANIFESLGWVWHDKNDIEKAELYFKKSLKIIITTFGELHKFTASSLLRIGNFWSLNEDFQQGKSYYIKALNIAMNLKSNDEILADIYFNLGANHNDSSDCKSALMYYSKALQIQLYVWGEIHSSTLSTYMRIGNIHVILGNFSKAFFYLRKATWINTKLNKRYFINYGFLFDKVNYTISKKRHVLMFFIYFLLQSLSGWRIIYRDVNGLFKGKSENSKETKVNFTKKIFFKNILFTRQNIFILTTSLIAYVLPDFGFVSLELIYSCLFGGGIGFFLSNVFSNYKEYQR